MINLFSIFDPSANFEFKLQWLRFLYPLLFIHLTLFLITPIIFIFHFQIYRFTKLEFKNIISKNFSITLLFNRVFIFILTLNFLGLIPYIFTPTSHIINTLILALPLWLLIIFFGWYKKTNSIFNHLLPTGTPNPLIPFIVIIETISNIIRPIALRVRLAANIVAGHLLLRLISNQITNNPTIFLYSGQTLLIILEIAVALVQAYVFIILVTLYISEINYDKTLSSISLSYF